MKFLYRKNKITTFDLQETRLTKGKSLDWKNRFNLNNKDN